MFTACLIPIIKLNALFQWSKKLIVKRVHFVFFWILRLCFDVLVDGTMERDYFFGFFDVKTLEMAALRCLRALPHPRKKIPNMGT